MFKDKALFTIIAPLVLTVNPRMDRLLRHHAAQSGWSELALKKDMDINERCIDDEVCINEVLEHKEAGGSVHLQPLLQFQPTTILTSDYEGEAVASLSGKTFREDAFLAFVAADNMLSVQRRICYEYLHIRSFQDGAVCTHPLKSDQLVRTRVQHGDLVATTMLCETPEIFAELHVFAGLPAEERFKRLRELCFLAGDDFFMAIVESDQDAQETDFVSGSVGRMEKGCAEGQGQCSETLLGLEEHFSSSAC